MDSTTDRRLRLDAHVHLAGFDWEKHGSFYRKSESPLMALARMYLGLSPRAGDEEFDIAYVEWLARMVREAEHLDKVVLFALDGVYDSCGRLDPRTEAIISNDWAIEACGLHPDEFILGASIHPARPDAMDELERCAEAGAVCVKWVPPSQGMDASDPRFEPFYERMRDLGLVLTSHTGYEHSLRIVDQSLGDPERLRLPLEVGLKVVAGHAGTSGFYHRVEYFPNLVKMIQRYENLYADTSAILNPVRAPYRKRLLAEPVVGRLIQGTDFPVPPLPILWPFALGPAEAIRFQRVKNWFDRDILAKKAAGFPEEHFRRGHDVFLGAEH